MNKTSLEEYRKFAIRVKQVVLGYNNNRLMYLVLTDENAQNAFLPYTYMSNKSSLNDSVKGLVQEYFSQVDLHWEQLKIDSQFTAINNASIISIAALAVIDFAAFKKPAKPKSNWQVLKSDTDSLSDCIENSMLGADDTFLLKQAFTQLQQRAKYMPLGFYLLGNNFTYQQIFQLFKLVLDIKMDRSNFRRKISATGLIEPIEIIESNVQHRPAQYYRFNQEKYELLKSRGFEFKF